MYVPAWQRRCGASRDATVRFWRYFNVPILRREIAPTSSGFLLGYQLSVNAR